MSDAMGHMTTLSRQERITGETRRRTEKVERKATCATVENLDEYVRLEDRKGPTSDKFISLQKERKETNVKFFFFQIDDAVDEEGRAGAEAMRERIILAINRIKSDAAHAATSVVI